jgi:hypothetical protein
LFFLPSFTPATDQLAFASGTAFNIATDMMDVASLVYDPTVVASRVHIEISCVASVSFSVELYRFKRAALCLEHLLFAIGASYHFLSPVPLDIFDHEISKDLT